MKTTLITALILLSTSIAALAADTDQKTDRQGGNIEQKKSRMLQRIDEKIANAQSEKACVQSSKTQSELQSCKEKFHNKHDKQKKDRNQ